MFLWRLIYPLPDSHEEEFTEVQPSYKHCRVRHQLLLQIRNSRVKLRKTFILSDKSYMNTTRRSATVRKRARISFQPLTLPLNPKFLYGF